MGIKDTGAIFLAHLNPLTLSHEKIIRNLLQSYRVYVFPVRFVKNGREINTRSFPFTYEIRKQMILESFEDDKDVCVLDDYTFFSPYLKYFPPFISSSFQNLKKNIFVNLKEHNFITYTGDRAERVLLKFFGFNPIKANRQNISSSNVKDLLYQSSIFDKNPSTGTVKSIEIDWTKFVSPKVVEIINKNWEIVENFAHSNDETIRIFGMKFPKDGFI